MTLILALMTVTTTTVVLIVVIMIIMITGHAEKEHDEHSNYQMSPCVLRYIKEQVA